MCEQGHDGVKIFLLVMGVLWKKKMLALLVPPVTCCALSPLYFSRDGAAAEQHQSRTDPGQCRKGL